MALWRAAEPLVLASKSAIRRSVLESAGRAGRNRRGRHRRARHRIAIRPRAIRARWRSFWRAKKRGRFPRQSPGRMVLGADQTLALGERRFSKAPDRAGAREQLKALRGNTHALHSAVAVLRDGSVLYRACGGGAADHARILRRISRKLSRRGRRRGAVERRRLSARRPRRAIDRSASRAIISRCWACRCSRCWNGCGRAGLLAK